MPEDLQDLIRGKCMLLETAGPESAWGQISHGLTCIEHRRFPAETHSTPNPPGLAQIMPDLSPFQPRSCRAWGDVWSEPMPTSDY